MRKKLTAGELKKLLKVIPDDAFIGYADYCKGAALNSFDEGTWTYPKDKPPEKAEGLILTFRRPSKLVDLGGAMARVMECPKCGVCPGNVDDCREFGNPQCPYFGKEQIKPTENE